jgi:hypothetical protein
MQPLTTNSRLARKSRDTIQRVHPPPAQRNTIQPLGTFVWDRPANRCFVIRDQSYQHNKIYNASRWFCLIQGHQELCDMWVMQPTITAGQKYVLWASARCHVCCRSHSVGLFVLLEQQPHLDKNTWPEGGPGALWNVTNVANRRIWNKQTTLPLESWVSLDVRQGGHIIQWTVLQEHWNMATDVRSKTGNWSDSCFQQPGRTIDVLRPFLQQCLILVCIFLC